MTDTELIALAKAGDDSAFEVLVKRHESRVAATVISMLGRCPEADDVGQETFIRFYNGLKNFRGDSNVATYITRIAINLSLNELKRRKRKTMLFIKPEYENSDIVDHNNQDQFNEEKEFVNMAIKKLQPKFQSVIVLRLIDGYSTEETAEILKIPVGTVLSRLARGQQKLKNLLSSYLGGLR